MPITIVCQCGKSSTVPDQFAGRRGRCKACRAVMVIPNATIGTGTVEPATTSRVAESLRSGSLCGETETTVTNEGCVAQSPEPTTRRFPQIWVLAGVLTLVASIGIGVFFYSRTSPPPTTSIAATEKPEVTRTMTTEDVVAKAEGSVCRVAGDFGWGSGFVVKPGLVATNAHVLSGQPESGLRLLFSSSEGEPPLALPASIVGYDEARDLAFLKVEKTPPPLEIAPSGAFRRGQEVVIIGNPGVGNMALQNAVSRGVLSTKVTIEGMAYEQLGASLNEGNSGGPVLDMEGRVVGVATLKANQEGVGFCIPRDELRTAIERCESSSAETVALAKQAHQKTLASKLANIFGDAYMKASPAKKMAMAERLDLIKNDDPLVSFFSDRLAAATDIYMQNDREIASTVLYVMSNLMKESKVSKPSEILDALIDTPPKNRRGAPKYECRDFARAYLMYRLHNGNHEVAMKMMRETSKLIEEGLVASYPQFARSEASGRDSVSTLGKESVGTFAEEPTLGGWFSCTVKSQIDTRCSALPEPPFEEKEGPVRILKGARNGMNLRHYAQDAAIHKARAVNRLSPLEHGRNSGHPRG